MKLDDMPDLNVLPDVREIACAAETVEDFAAPGISVLMMHPEDMDGPIWTATPAICRPPTGCFEVRGADGAILASIPEDLPAADFAHLLATLGAELFRRLS